jgi:hypothetical protein
MLLASSLFFLITTAFAQQTVSGRVTDEKGNPVEGISVNLKGPQPEQLLIKMVITHQSFRHKPVLVFSGIGFNDREVNAFSAANVSLETAAITLTGVEMVGTRNLKRSSTETPVPVDIIPIQK